MTWQGFIAARLDDDERAAHEHGGRFHVVCCLRELSPARVHRDVASTRELVQLVTGEAHHYNDDDPWFSCALAVAPGETEPGSGCCNDTLDPGKCSCGRDARVDRFLRVIAGRWSDHPGYAALTHLANCLPRGYAQG